MNYRLISSFGNNRNNSGAVDVVANDMTYLKRIQQYFFEIVLITFFRTEYLLMSSKPYSRLARLDTK